jgi:hypothetical protein
VSNSCINISPLSEQSLDKYLKKLTGKTDIEVGLKRLDNLTQDKAWVATAQVLKATQNAGEREGGVARQPLRVEIQRWLSPSDPSINYNVARKARHEETAQWFLQGKDYAEWKTTGTGTGTGTLLWVHGKRVFGFLPLRSGC